MSGCYPSETLSLCEHGKPIKFPCLLCEPAHSEINLLDIVNDLNSLRNRIEALHCNKLWQLDENRKISRRIERLESENKMRQDTIACLDSVYNDACRKIEKRLEDIEKWSAQVESNWVFAKVKFIEIDDLNRKFADFMQKSCLNCEKRPFKCPVCDGCGNDKGTRESNPNYDFCMKYASCNTCEGKGIIWS
jgi:hypothetical protein